MLAPMLVLCFFSVVLGYFLSSQLADGLLFHDSIILHTDYALDVRQHVYYELAHPLAMMEHSLFKLPLYFSLFGLLLSWYWYEYLTGVQREQYCQSLSVFCYVLRYQYGLNYLLEGIIVPCIVAFASLAYRLGDVLLLNRLVDYAIANNIIRLSATLRTSQTGSLQHYLIYIVLGVFITLSVVWYQLISLGVLA